MTDIISQRARAYLAAWHSRRPTLALMGEFSSGKSALLNCLLDRRLLPTRVTATDMPAIWISHGATERVTGLGFDGHLVELTMAELTEGQAMRFLCIRIEIDAKILERVDIIDTPGISDPRMTTDIVEEVARNVDFVVWCSPMTQAWRQTERAFWKALPDRIKLASILALTRADLIASTRDTDKVIRRCTAESDGSFSAVLPVAAPLAAKAKAASSD
ncbi:dynamin family protein [Rhodobacter sp. SY28-1]|uniref:dynamin family protein n=1 Tax=Rhodobacter sp. SY28-1 TaxID=2562317 RepID=UPI0010C0BEB4|nr:dynamin family protein [Rhodobacter sp. SY28-1]